MKARWREIAGIDLRSMALFRLGLGAFILLDLINRAADLTAHYTWDGVISASMMKAAHGKLIYLTPHYYCAASVVTQAGLFLLHGLLALALLVGWRTRIMTVACWFLASSLQMSNGALWYGADDVLRMCLFWGMFLPLGARFSLDSAAARPPRPMLDAYVSAATVAYLVQIAIIYLAAAVFKLQSSYWIEGSAVRYALHYDWYVTWLGIWMREQAWLIPWLTYGTIAVEAGAPLLVLAPFWNGPLRMIGTAALMALHVGFILTMSILLFPYASLVCLLPLVPTWFWERLFRRLRTAERMQLQVFFDGTCQFCRRGIRVIHTFLLLPETKVAPVAPDSEEERLMQAQRSWVVVTGDGRSHTHFHAFTVLVRHSPWAWWAAWILALRPAHWLGDRLYRCVAAHRSRLAPWSEPLAERPLGVRPYLVTQVFVVVALALVLGLALRTLKVPIRESPLDKVARVLRLGPQNWSMFGMGNEVSDSWLVMPARLADESTVDLLRGGTPVDWSKPARVGAIYPSYRWMQYLHFKPRWPVYTRYAQEAWNRRHGPDRQIVDFEIYAMVEVTRADGVDPPRKVLLHRPASRRKSARPGG